MVIMRDLIECRNEVFRRSESRIKARKRIRKRILMLCIPICLVVCVVSTAVHSQLLFKSADNAAPESIIDAGVGGIAEFSSVQVYQGDTEMNNISDSDVATNAFSSIITFFENEKAGATDNSGKPKDNELCTDKFSTDYHGATGAFTVHFQSTTGSTRKFAIFNNSIYDVNLQKEIYLSDEQINILLEQLMQTTD